MTEKKEYTITQRFYGRCTLATITSVMAHSKEEALKLWDEDGYCADDGALEYFECQDEDEPEIEEVK